MKKIITLLATLLGMPTTAQAEPTPLTQTQPAANFQAWWNRMHELNPTDFPLEMTSQQWNARWNAWNEWMDSNPNVDKYLPYQPSNDELSPA